VRVVRQQVAEYLAEFEDPVAVAERLAEAPDKDRAAARLAEIDQQSDAAEQKRRRLALAYAGGAMDMVMYRETDDGILDDLARLEAEADVVRAVLARVVDPEQRFGEIQETRLLLDEMFDEMPAIEIATALRNIGLRVEIENRQIVSVSVT
jgi:hypothetical protein